MVFLGTPAIAVPALRALCEWAAVPAVVCQPDRPAGRGLQLSVPAVKLAAQELGIPVHQPHKVKTELGPWLAGLNADAALVMAYGRILPRAVLDAPRFGCINLHASLLPRYRGAAPIQWAIMRGETTTGISLMHMVEGLDEGPVYSQRQLAIGPEETGGELSSRLAELSAEVTREDLPAVLRREFEAEPQDPEKATFAPPLLPEHLQIDWQRSAPEIFNQIRALAPRPGARTSVRGKSIRILKARVFPPDTSQAAPITSAPGSLRIDQRRAFVETGERGVLEILEAQIEGKKVLSAQDLINGRALAPSDVFGT